MANWKQAFLTELREKLQPLFQETVLTEDREGEPLLQLVVAPAGAQAIPIQLGFETVGKGMLRLSIHMMLAELDKSILREAEALVCRLNELLVVGSFGILYGADLLFFRCSLPAGEDMPAQLVADDAYRTLGLAMETAGMAYEPIASLLDGKLTADALAQGDFAVIQ